MKSLAFLLLMLSSLVWRVNAGCTADTMVQQLQQVPAKYVADAGNQAQQLDAALDKKSEQYLSSVLLNDIKPTAERSLFDKMANFLAPITSSITTGIVKYLKR